MREECIVNEGERRKSAEEGLNHEGSYQVEEAQYLNANRSYTFKPNINLPTHYTPALRNHENNGGGAQQGPRPRQKFTRLMLSPGSKNSSNIGTIEENIRVRKGLNHLKIRCWISCQKTREF